MKLSIERSDDGQFFIRLKSRNGQILMVSETYTRKNGAQRTARRIRDAFRAHREIDDNTISR